MIRVESLFATNRESTISRPIDHLMACHRRIEERLATLERIAEHAGAQPEEARAAFASVIRFMDSAGELHTIDEEESVFPRLLPRLDASGREFVAGLEHDHEAASRLYAEIKRLAAEDRFDEDFAKAVSQLVALYRGHIAREDEVLTALARMNLTADELSQISGEMVARRKASEA